MSEQTTREFYTLPPEQKLVESEFEKEGYDCKTATEILKEAAKYQIDLETVAKSWYEDEETRKFDTKSIEPEQIVVREGKFYGCLLTREYSEWGYRDMDKGTRLTSVTLDNPKTNVYTMDHSTQNGDSYYITDAYLVKKEQ